MAIGTRVLVAVWCRSVGTTWILELHVLDPGMTLGKLVDWISSGVPTSQRRSVSRSIFDSRRRAGPSPGKALLSSDRVDAGARVQRNRNNRLPGVKARPRRGPRPARLGPIRRPGGGSRPW